MNEKLHNGTQGKFTGFFGMFDILGYRSLIENNDLDRLIEIFDQFIKDLDQKGVTLNGQDKSQITALVPTKTFVFSDTIIFYQARFASMPDFGPSFLTQVCVLLRLAFERGIPLRGAISFGDFFVHEKSFLGKPIVEAYEAEHKQEWSGVMLTESAESVYLDYKGRRESSKNINNRGFSLNPADMGPFSPNIVVDTDIPVRTRCESQRIKGYSLRWDDYIKDFATLQVEDFNVSKSREYIESRVRDSFSAYGKKTDSDDIKRKIENTIKFLEDMRDRPLDNTRLTFIP